MRTIRKDLFEYLNVTEDLTKIDFNRLEQIRSTYANILQTNPDDPLTSLAQTFGLLTDAENREYLNTCVTSASKETAAQSLFGKYLDKKLAEKTISSKGQTGNDNGGIEYS